jgi:hypothetical protein
MNHLGPTIIWIKFFYAPLTPATELWIEAVGHQQVQRAYRSMPVHGYRRQKNMHSAMIRYYKEQKLSATSHLSPSRPCTTRPYTMIRYMYFHCISRFILVKKNCHKISCDVI